MKLGAFSVSLKVKDIVKSKAFYQTLGFIELGESGAQNWAILKNGDHIIGLFEGMLDNNMLTFNPGWDQDAQALDEFTDIREIQKQLKALGIELDSQANEDDQGPASLTLTDPDGNVILIDQHR